MGIILKGLKKYLFIYSLFMKSCLMAQMEYRFNFYMSFLLDCAFLLIRILYVVVVYQTGIVVNGLSPDAILLFIGTFTVMSGVYAFFYVNNFFKVSEYVRQGMMDVFITKPISLQFMVTLRYVDFGLAIPDLIGGAIMIFTACSRLGISFNILNIMGFIGLLVSSTIITYGIFLFPHILSFWVVKTTAINNITDTLFEFNNMPMDIYSKWIQRIGLFIVPLFVISNFPAMFLLNRLNTTYIIWAIVAPVICLTLVILFWRFAIKNYTSASS